MEGFLDEVPLSWAWLIGIYGDTDSDPSLGYGEDTPGPPPSLEDYEKELPKG